MLFSLRLSLILLVACTIAGCGRRNTPELTVQSQTQQKITTLNEADKNRLREERAVVERYIGDPASKEKYKTAAGKLGTIRAILQAGAFKRNQTYELQSLGVVFGDAFVQELKMEWVMVEDEHGRDPAIRMPGTSIIIYPLTMISKRVERGEQIDIFDMFNGTAAQIEQMKEHGN